MGLATRIASREDVTVSQDQRGEPVYARASSAAAIEHHSARVAIEALELRAVHLPDDRVTRARTVGRDRGAMRSRRISSDGPAPANFRSGRRARLELDA